MKEGRRRRRRGREGGGGLKWVSVGFLTAGVRCDARGCDLNYYSFRGIDQLCLVYFAENICAQAIDCFNL